MIEVLYIIALLSVACFNCSLLALRLSKKGGNERQVRTSRGCVGLSIYLGVASLLGMGLNSCGLLLNGWVGVGSLVIGVLLTIVAFLAAEKFDDIACRYHRLLCAVGCLGGLFFFLSLELCLVHIFSEGIDSGISFCVCVSLIVALVLWVDRATKREQTERETEKQTPEQLKSETLTEDQPETEDTSAPAQDP